MKILVSFYIDKKMALDLTLNSQVPINVFFPLEDFSNLSVLSYVIDTGQLNQRIDHLKHFLFQLLYFL